MESFLSLLGVIFSGGATGLVGVLFQRYFDYKAKQQDLELVKINNEHARLLAQMEVDKANRAAEATERVAQMQAEASEKVAQQQANAQINVAELDAQARADEAAARSYVASIESDRAAYLDPKTQARSKFARVMMTIVDSVRGLIRPVLTIYMVVVATVMFSWASNLAKGDGKSIDAAEAAKLVKSIIDTLLYLTTTCVVWWFGVRPSAKAKQI